MGPIYKMQPTCHKCGKNLALVGRVHSCTPLLMAAVNTVVNTADVVNTAVNKRGAYPATEERRKYMREYMRKKRAK
jgi:hypothetical protein